MSSTPAGPATVCAQAPDGARPAGVHHQDQQPPQLDRFLRRERTKGRIGGEPPEGEAREPIIVHQPAVEQLHVTDSAVVIALKGIGIRLEQRWSILVVAHALDPSRQRHRTAAWKILDDNGRKEHGHRRRCRHRKRNRIARKIAAQRAECRLAEYERRAVIDIGSVDPDPRPRPSQQAFECRVLEQIGVEPAREFGRIVDAALQPARDAAEAELRLQ